MAKKITFEEALERLKKSVARLDADDLTLDEMVTAYEEGHAMAKVCEDRLSQARGKVLKLSQSGDGVAEKEMMEDGE